MPTRSQLIAKAASLPVGHPERKRLLLGLHKGASHNPPLFPDLEVKVTHANPYPIRMVILETAFEHYGDRALRRNLQILERESTKVANRMARGIAKLGFEWVGGLDLWRPVLSDDETTLTAQVGLRIHPLEGVDDRGVTNKDIEQAVRRIL